MEYNSELIREREINACDSVTADYIELNPLSSPGEYRITAWAAVDEDHDVTSITFYIRRGSIYHNYKRGVPTAAAEIEEGPVTVHASAGDVIGCCFVGGTLADSLQMFVEMLRYPVGQMPV